MRFTATSEPVRTGALWAVALAACLPAAAAATEGLEHFEKRVRPLLAAQCQACHNPQLQSGGIDLASGEGFAKARDEAALISLEDPASSRLLAIVGYTARVKMPPGGKLSEEDLGVLGRWVREGAPWPGAELRAAVLADSEQGAFTEEQLSYWAFQPVSQPRPPAVSNLAWPRNAIDRFILAKLEQQGLEPAPPVSRLTWLRRAHFDLTGLPPSPDEALAFSADRSPGAWERAVDRLLASPRYGERWGRHWLDVARYADSTGNDEDHRYPYAWKYRDYVIEAFNSDLPYDRFVTEQIAGDLLSTEPDPRGVIATGFLALGPKAIAQQDKTRMLYDVYDEQIEVVSKAMLGLTVACARCHDHKFDPILTKDYYSLAGIFASTRSFRDAEAHVSRMLLKPLVPQEQYERYQAEQMAIKNRRIERDNVGDIEIEQLVEAEASRVAEYMLAARRAYEDGEDEASVAGAEDLDAGRLAKWVAYLRPVQPKRAQLADWHSAGPDQRAVAAAAYQQRFEGTLKEWHHTIRRWRKDTIELIRNGTMPPRPKPRFQAGRDRFFFDVYAAKDGPLLSFRGEERDRALQPQTLAAVRRLGEELEKLERSAIPEPPMANAVEDGEPVEQHVFVRGDYSAKGEPAPKVFPAILAGFDQQPVRTGSGRLELARWIASPSNPLTARVMANRIWQKQFGQGIVRTPSNFGKLGAPPTHPELLDWLAADFVEQGWSVKAMHRRILLSSTYRSSSATSAEAAEADPENLWLSRFHRRRLDVEELRDGMLAVDGSIEFAMGGTLQSGFGTDRENSNDRLSIDPATTPRRLVYIPLRRANLPTLLNLFDFGDAVTSLGKRPVTNVAPQALFMMNSEFVARRASNLAQLLMASVPGQDAERARRAHLAVLTREPSGAEVDTALSYLAQLMERFPEASERDAWASYCRILLASNEFLYID